MTQDRSQHMPGTKPMTTRLPVDFSAFHQIHRPAYIRWAETCLANRADAEEAVDAAFEQLLGIWATVLSKENPAGYAWTVLRSRTIDLARARGRRAALLDAAAFEAAALRDAVDPIGQLEESLGLFHAIGRLPSRQMDVMVLLYIHDLTADEVAAELGITAAGVRSNVRHAKRRLRQILGLPEHQEGHSDDIR
ncbi:sigma-70 family RNA polymerase sigma factor [Streptomyces tsukubensis]